MAYFFERIFPKKTPIKDSYYTINAVKGFFDACNHSPYTAIYELDTTYYKLRETVLFKACYLVIQCAWFFNSEHFGRHQYLEYASHYIKTGNNCQWKIIIMIKEIFCENMQELMKNEIKISPKRGTLLLICRTMVFLYSVYGMQRIRITYKSF